MLSLAVAAAVALGGSTAAHMVLQDPLRFPSIPTTNNGPMEQFSNSNYPCKFDGTSSFYAFDFPRTQLPAGGKYSMALTGTVVHGGGSCQMSLTRDMEPTSKSIFKVIHSVHGGCTGRGVTGNLEPANKDAPGPDKYEFPIPDGIEPGNYTFAWTWFNDVGNREMYMNCAPVTVSGGSTKTKRDGSFYDSLPDIFLANIPDVSCKSSKGETSTIRFPNPGSSVEENPVMNYPKHLVDAVNPRGGGLSSCHAPPNAQGAAAGSGGAVSSSLPVVQSSSAIPMSSVAASSSLAAISSSSVLASSSLTAMPTSSVAVSSSMAAEPTSSTAATPSSVPQQPFVSNSSSNAAPASGGSGSCPSTSVPCPTPGDIICVGTSQFGLCDTNNCAIVQALATGTTCSNNVITKRSKSLIPSISYKRHGVHPHGVGHRHSPLH